MKLPDRVNQSPITVEFEWRGEVVAAHLIPVASIGWTGKLLTLAPQIESDIDVDCGPGDRSVDVWAHDELGQTECEKCKINKWWFS